MVQAWATPDTEVIEPEIHPLEGLPEATVEAPIAEPPVEVPVEPVSTPESPAETPAPTPVLPPAELQELEGLRREAATQAQKNEQLVQDKAVEDSIGLVRKKYEDAGWDTSFVDALVGELRGVQTRSMQERGQLIQYIQSEGNKQQWAAHFAKQAGVSIADVLALGARDEKEMEARSNALKENNQLKARLAVVEKGRVPGQPYDGGAPAGGAMTGLQILDALGNGTMESDKLTPAQKALVAPLIEV